MTPTNMRDIVVRLLTQIFFVSAALLLVGCDPQKRPTILDATTMKLQTDSLASDHDTNTFKEEKSKKPLISPDADGDETSLLATETIDPEANETAVTIVILPQKRNADIEASQKISDDQRVADTSSKAVTDPSDETVIATFKKMLHPDTLVSMTALEVEKKIGPADFIRHEGVIITWQYRMPACVIDLFIPFNKTTPRKGIANGLVDNMQISGTYMRSRIHDAPFKETECLTAFSERRLPAN